MDVALLQRRLERERLARKEAEKLLEAKSLQLYEANKVLKGAVENLEQEVANSCLLYTSPSPRDRG